MAFRFSDLLVDLLPADAAEVCPDPSRPPCPDPSRPPCPDPSRPPCPPPSRPGRSAADPRESLTALRQQLHHSLAGMPSHP